MSYGQVNGLKYDGAAIQYWTVGISAAELFTKEVKVLSCKALLYYIGITVVYYRLANLIH